MTPSSLHGSAEPAQPMNAGSIHTQGNNFLQAVQSSADPRTGQFNLTIGIPLGQANDLSGPSWPFTVAYHALSSQQDDGFGLGWTLLYTRLVREQDVWTLQLSSGEHFSVDLAKSDVQPGGRLAFHDYKLHAMQVSVLTAEDGDGEIVFRVLHKSGEQEFLRRVGASGNAYVLHELRSAEGRRLHFDWLQIGTQRHLHTVRDQQRVLAYYDRLQRTLTLEPDSTQPCIIRFVMTNGELGRLVLPDVAQPFVFTYQNQAVGDQRLRLPVDVTGPLGARDTITWSSTLQSSHRLPTKAPIAFMPRVTSWLHSAGPSTPALLRRYTWTGSRNYLGGDSPQGFDWRAGRDSLYRLMTRYEYQCTETQIAGDTAVLQWLQDAERFAQVQVDSLLPGLMSENAVTLLTTIARTWDRHHLPIKEVTLTGTCQTRRETTYGVDYDKPWQDQVPQCQLPCRIETTFTDTQAQTCYTETTTYTYDVFGNTLHTQLPTQVEEVYEYYPASGDVDGCPRDASGMVRWLKRKTVHPAPDCPGSARSLCTRYEYEALPSLIGTDPDHLVVCLEELLDHDSGQVLESTSQTYERVDPAHYGRQVQVTTTLNGKATTTLFEYSLLHDTDEPPLLCTRKAVKGWENTVQTTSTSEDSRSLLTGLTHREVSAAGVRTRFAYDAIGRVTRTVIAEDTAYQTQRTCDYHLDDDFVAQYAPRLEDDLAVRIGLEETDATGRRKRTWLDGNARPVRVQLEDLDHRPGVFADVLETRYDAWGREVEQVGLDWAADGSLLFRTTASTVYDDWGNPCRQTDAAGVVTHTLHDPSRRRTERWQQSPAGDVLGKHVTLFNAAGSPLCSEVFDDQASPVRTTRYLRDGLDRVVEEQITPREGPVVVTQFDYDHYDRLSARRQRFLQDGQSLMRTVFWEYAAHSDGDHPESVSVTVNSPRGAR